MSSANSTPKYFTPPQIPVMQRRTTATPSRPSTSSGETIEPKSDFLRDALRERKGLSPRSQANTARRAKTLVRAQTNPIAHDELFLPSSEDEPEPPIRRNPFRPQRTRRASEDVNMVKASPSTTVRTLGLREADAQMDKLLKENWDLKHRITLHDQAYSKTRQELDEALIELDKCATLRDRNRELEEAIVAISKQAAASEAENKGLRVDNADLTVLNDDLVRELEQKDDGIQQRQMAIEEAAGIIQTLEVSLESLKSQRQISPTTESDYFSGDTGSSLLVKNTTRPTTSGTCGTECTNPPDSDYFSGDNSPNLAPSTPKTASLQEEKNKALQLERVRTTGAAFNRQVGLRSQISKDSLFSRFLEDPKPERSKYTSRALRPASPNEDRRAEPAVGSIREELMRSGTPKWTDARELRAIYENGYLNKQIGTQAPNHRTGYTPSVTVASVSAAPSIDSIYNLRATHQSKAAFASMSMSASAVPPKLFTFDTVTSTHSAPRAQMPSNPTPVNYNIWPRQLPEWPPSAGLKNRDILFHGTGMEEMFSNSPPRSTARKEPFPNVHVLYPMTGPERAARSLSAAPAANAVALPPPPPVRANSLSNSTKPSTSPALARRRLSPIRRSNTLPPQ